MKNQIKNKKEDNFIKLIDNYDNSEVFLLRTDFTKSELENELSIVNELSEDGLVYEDALIRIREKYPEKKLEIVETEEIYI